MAKRRAKKPVAASVKQKFPYAYVEDTDSYTTLFDGLANGAEVEHLIMDNSVGFGNEVVHFRKITLQFGWQCQVAGTAMALLMAVMRDTEGTTPIALDSTSAVRDARNENKLLRGPWMMLMSSQLGDRTMGKTLVLRELTLDQNDDLKIVFTNMSGQALNASAHHLYVFMKAWYKKVGA